MTITQFTKDVLHLSSSAPTYWKRGAVPGSDILYQAAKYFHVSTDYLLGLDDVPSRRQQEAPTPAETEMLSAFRSASPFARAIAWASAHAALSVATAQQEQFNSALANTEPLGYAMTIPAGGNLPIEGFAAAGSPLFCRTEIFCGRHCNLRPERLIFVFLFFRFCLLQLDGQHRGVVHLALR